MPDTHTKTCKKGGGPGSCPGRWASGKQKRCAMSLPPGTSQGRAGPRRGVWAAEKRVLQDTGPHITPLDSPACRARRAAPRPHFLHAHGHLTGQAQGLVKPQEEWVPPCSHVCPPSRVPGVWAGHCFQAPEADKPRLSPQTRRGTGGAARLPDVKQVLGGCAR